jgi:4-amino-4-deoxy-L-arabinose transferase-like glycosyltransferase
MMQNTGSKIKSVWIHTIVLVAISLPYCINLGKSSIWDANEAFYAETPREMMASGDYLAPHFNFEPRAQKPPLTYWVILIFYRIFGVSEFSVRLPSALATIGTILFTYGVARILFSSRAALFAAAIIATTPRVFILARRLPIDVYLLFFLTGTLFLLVRAIQKRGRFAWIPVYVFAGLGFLTKGPIAVLIPAGTYLLWCLCRRQIRISDAHPLSGAAIFLCIVLPWYVRIYLVHGWTYIAPFFLRDNLGRYAAESLGPSRSVFYYLSVYATDFFPWAIPALLAIGLFWFLGRREKPVATLSFGLPLLWCGLIFVLFSLSKNKQEYYIAPIYPAAAVILAGFLDRNSLGINRRDRNPAEGDRPALNNPWTWTYGLLAILLLMLAFLVPYAIGSFTPNVSIVLHYGPAFVLAAGFLLLAWSIIRGGHARCFSALVIPLWIIYVMGALVYLPALEPFRPVKSFCQTIEAQSHRDDEAGFYGTALPSMVYYLRRPIFQESNPERMLRRFRSEKRVFCVLDKRDFGYFSEKQGLNLHILDRHPRFSVRIGTLLNAGYFPGEELFLVSNRSFSQPEPDRSGPKS